MSEMTPQAWNSLCEVFVPIDDGGNGRIATGFPIAHDRIVTCAHVLDGLLAGSTPEVRWPHLEVDQPGRPLGDDYLAFDGRAAKQKVDAAVLKVDLPPGASIARLCPGYPEEGRRTSSRGFPDVGVREEKRHPVPIDGELLSYAEADDLFEIGVRFEHGIEDGWRGASGSPVFISGGLVGIHVECPKPFDNNRLKATPLYRLLRIPDFCKAIDLEQQHHGFSRLRDCAIDLLTDSELTSTLQEITRPTRSTASSIRAADAVFSALLTLDAQGVLDALLESLTRLTASRKSRAIQTLDTLALTLLPLIFNRDDVDRLWRHIRGGDGQPILLSVDTGGMMLAEAIMSAADGRVMQLRRRPTKKYEDVHGDEYFLNPPPDAGVDPGQVAGQADFRKLLSRQLLGKDEAVLEDSDLHKKIVNSLDKELKWTKCHYYFLYRRPRDGGNVPLYEQLSRDFPQVAFLGLAPSESVEDDIIKQDFNRLRLQKVSP